MIESLGLEDFQIHRSLSVTFGEGVTVIVGPTGKGKSALSRALRLLCLDLPKGNAGIRNGKKKLALRAAVDGRELTRSKGTKNLYHLDGKEFAAFGNCVPGEIQDLLRCSDLNFQRQHDGLFWLALPAPEAGRRLDECAGLGAIESVASAAASLVKSSAADLAAAERRLEASEKALEASEGAEGRLQVCEALEALQNEREALERHCLDLSDLTEDWRRAAAPRPPEPPEWLEAAAGELAGLLATSGELARLAERWKREGRTWSMLEKDATATLCELREVEETLQICPSCLRPLDG